MDPFATKLATDHPSPTAVAIPRELLAYPLPRTIPALNGTAKTCACDGRPDTWRRLTVHEPRTAQPTPLATCEACGLTVTEAPCTNAATVSVIGQVLPEHPGQAFHWPHIQHRADWASAPSTEHINAEDLQEFERHHIHTYANTATGDQVAFVRDTDYPDKVIAGWVNGRAASPEIVMCVLCDRPLPAAPGISLETSIPVLLSEHGWVPPARPIVEVHTPQGHVAEQTWLYHRNRKATLSLRFDTYGTTLIDPTCVTEATLYTYGPYTQTEIYTPPALRAAITQH